VHKARILLTGDIVAVKIIPVSEQDEIAAIQKEIAMLRECAHPNIVQYYGSWRTRDALWICMEYCAGGSVSDVMHTRGGGLDEDMVAHICGQALAGLAYLHSVGKVHRDIKCGNILLTEAGEVKLADFGVAAQLTNTMSKRNTFIGTPHWMAPEVIQVSQYDGKVRRNNHCRLAGGETCAARASYNACMCGRPAPPLSLPPPHTPTHAAPSPPAPGGRVGPGHQRDRDG
jgi:serine/threonine-protein kinase 24/25/MST4